MSELNGLSAARDINDRGQVLGESQTDGRPVLWENGTMTPLDPPPGTVFSAAALNGNGQVVGWLSVPGVDGSEVPVLWQNGDFRELPTLFPNAMRAWARGINNRGEIVGSEFVSGSGGHAVMWIPIPDDDDWTFCAPEGGVCAFTGTTEVRYGANGTYVYQTFTEGTACNNEVFGDPLYGTRKSCAITILPAPTEWTFCAAEGDVCAFTGTAEVRYGANGAYVYQTLTEGTACTNEVFGDPIYGTVKACAIRIPPDPTEWTFCASEGGICAFTGAREVRYGANGAYVYQTLLDGTACTNQVFGDPIYGSVKYCAMRIPPPPTDWTFCAPEGGFCAFTGTGEVRYGANGVYVYQMLLDGTACTNQVFGDPTPNVPKQCAIRNTPPQYTIDDLGATFSDPFRINDRGVITAHRGSDGIRIAATAVDILWPGHVDDINAASQIVGLSVGQAVVWSEGTVTALAGGGARGLNDLGDVVGYGQGGAVLWQNDGTEVVLPNLGTTEIFAEDINNAGEIVGQGRDANGGPMHAIAWRNGVIRRLATITSADGSCFITPNDRCGSRAHRINSAGMIVGTSDVPGGGFHPVIWTDDAVIDLGSLGGPTSGGEGVGINDSGWVVGDSDSRAFLFDGIKMHDLNTLIQGRSPFTRLAAAQSINNVGDIVGVGLVGEKIHGFFARRVR